MLYHRSTAGFLSTVLLMWVSAGFQVKLTGSAVLYFSFFTERGDQPVTLEPSATPAFLSLKVTVVPSGRAGEWQASLALGRRMHVSCMHLCQGTAAVERLAPLPLTGCSFLGTLLCTGQVLNTGRFFNVAHAVKGWVLWDYRNLYFFQVIPVQLLKLCLITVLVLFMWNRRYVFLIKDSHTDAVYFY